VRPRLEVRPR